MGPEDSETGAVVVEEISTPATQPGPDLQGLLDLQDDSVSPPEVLPVTTNCDDASQEGGALQGTGIARSEGEGHAIAHDGVRAISPGLSDSWVLESGIAPTLPPESSEEIPGDGVVNTAAVDSPVVRMVVRKSLQRAGIPSGDPNAQIETQAVTEEGLEDEIQRESEDILEHTDEIFDHEPRATSTQDHDIDASDLDTSRNTSGDGERTGPGAQDEGSGETPIDDKEPEDPLLLVNDNSASRLEWIRQKRDQKANIDAFDELMKLLGRENVKGEFLSMKAAIDARKRRRETEYDESVRFTVDGNVGTGNKALTPYTWSPGYRILTLELQL